MSDAIPITCAGFEGRALSLQPAGLWKGATILCDGVPAPRKGRTFTLTNNRGEPVTLKFAGNLFDLRIDAGGAILRPYPPMPWWGYGLIVLPFALAGVGGLVGGLIGAAAGMTNRQILRTQQPAGLRILYCVLVIAGATVIWLVVAVVLALLLRR
jgi:hypothetical protein